MDVHEKPTFASIQKIVVVTCIDEENGSTETFQVIQTKKFRTGKPHRGLWSVSPTNETSLLVLNQVEQIQCILVPPREMLNRSWDRLTNDSLIVRFNRLPITYAPQ